MDTKEIEIRSLRKFEGNGDDYMCGYHRWYVAHKAYMEGANDERELMKATIEAQEKEITALKSKMEEREKAITDILNFVMKLNN